jgi:hypothetical protein
MSERLGSHLKISVETVMSDVTIRLSCRDEYEAVTLFEDILHRIQDGTGIFIGNNHPLPRSDISKIRPSEN